MRTLVFMGLLCLSISGNAQLLKKLGKRAKEAAERTIERRVEKETTEKTDEVLDSILEPNTPTPNDIPTPDSPPNGSHESGTQKRSNTPNSPTTPTNAPKSLSVYSKFDFVPGDEQIFFDDFGQDFIGDFPSKWNTNGGGEVVTLEGTEGKWLDISNNSFLMPLMKDGLPEEYTIEFDMRYLNLSGNTSSVGGFATILSSDSSYDEGENYVQALIDPCQYISQSVEIRNSFKKDPNPIRNDLGGDVRAMVREKVHVSLAVNKNRFRFWMNEIKIADIPQLIVEPQLIKYIKFKLSALDRENNNERLLISNIKIAKGGVDLRRKLLSEGRISTNGILFDSGSDVIKPESMGIIMQIYQVLQQDPSIRLNIIGHTDSEGSEEGNQTLSEKRAAAVKKALVEVYGIDSKRLSSEGKGESKPVGDNNTLEGKAQNRRVEFVKM